MPARFFTSRRSRITPEQAGLRPHGGHRRVSGLRREEGALLAGITVEYHTQLPRPTLHREGPLRDAGRKFRGATLGTKAVAGRTLSPLASPDGQIHLGLALELTVQTGLNVERLVTDAWMVILDGGLIVVGSAGRRHHGRPGAGTR